MNILEKFWTYKHVHIQHTYTSICIYMHKYIYIHKVTVMNLHQATIY